ncbi:hypothetical protein VP01_1729g3 [Puccinia sorghi]|uniref:Uncharacterized protein n=1 Tax=Puccinia sorghi TaxID=27349 RepID=A0A0L6VF92_9BASI|nr:hypothetical protein VP01_1729g3 [Puccinia sorghi]
MSPVIRCLLIGPGVRGIKYDQIEHFKQTQCKSTVGIFIEILGVWRGYGQEPIFDRISRTRQIRQRKRKRKSGISSVSTSLERCGGIEIKPVRFSFLLVLGTTSFDCRILGSKSVSMSFNYLKNNPLPIFILRLHAEITLFHPPLWINKTKREYMAGDKPLPNQTIDIQRFWQEVIPNTRGKFPPIDELIIRFTLTQHEHMPIYLPKNVEILNSSMNHSTMNLDSHFDFEELNMVDMRSSQEASVVTPTMLQNLFNQALMHSHCSDFTVTVPKILHRKTCGVWMEVTGACCMSTECICINTSKLQTRKLSGGIKLNENQEKVWGTFHKKWIPVDQTLKGYNNEINILYNSRSSLFQIYLCDITPQWRLKGFPGENYSCPSFPQKIEKHAIYYKPLILLIAATESLKRVQKHNEWTVIIKSITIEPSYKSIVESDHHLMLRFWRERSPKSHNDYFPFLEFPQKLSKPIQYRIPPHLVQESKMMDSGSKGFKKKSNCIPNVKSHCRFPWSGIMSVLMWMYSTCYTTRSNHLQQLCLRENMNNKSNNNLCTKRQECNIFPPPQGKSPEGELRPNWKKSNSFEVMNWRMVTVTIKRRPDRW